MNSLKIRAALFAICLLAVTGCASHEDDGMQKVDIASVPPGATCNVSQGNKATWRHAMVTGREEIKYQLVATITTPSSVKVPRLEGNLNIVCNLDGFKETTQVDESAQSTWSLANSKTSWYYGTPVKIIMDRP